MKKYYTGIDWHKRYSVVCTLDARGNRVREARIEGNEREGFERYFERLDGVSEVVHEACWNWEKLYEMLEGMAGVERVVLAHPCKTRLIADAQIKTDRLDAKALATLLRGNFVAGVYVACKPAREAKRVLRQRLYWARMRTRVRNRIHAVLDRQHELELPQCSDLFGTRGMKALWELRLPEPDAGVLRRELELHDVMVAKIKELEKNIQADNIQNPIVRRLQTLPGMGTILASVAAREIDDIERFRRSDRLCAYAGLAPTTYSSGGKTSHGRLLPWCNKWLRWALIEASWVAIGCDGYFGSLYQRHRNRGKKANTAIIIVARRMCQILWNMLKQNRDFQARPHPTRRNDVPGCSHAELKVAMKT